MIGQVFEGSTTNLFKLTEDDVGTIFFSGRVIPLTRKKGGNRRGWMIATTSTGLMLLHGILDSKSDSEAESCELTEKTMSNLPLIEEILQG